MARPFIRKQWRKNQGAQGTGEGHDAVKRQPGIECLRGIFERYPDIRAVYLFGPVAGHGTRSRVILTWPSSRGARRSLKLGLLADLARHGFCDVDVVFLDVDDIAN